MNTVTSVSIENPGKGYVNGTARVVLNLEHGENDGFANCYVNLTVNASGEVTSAIPIDGMTGLNFEVNDLVFIYPDETTTELCILKIVSVEGP